MPNQQITDDNYRYAYQGQEVDPETGMEAFQLRLWDGRLGRWLNPDPKGQYFSPYLGMGNNPVGMVDPDGGQTDDFYQKLDANGNATGEIVWFNGSDDIDGYRNLGSSYSVRDSYNNLIAFGNFDNGVVTQWNKDWMSNGRNGFYYPSTSEVLVTNRVINNNFYRAPLDGEMFLTDSWGDLQSRHHNGLDIVYERSGQINGANVYAPVSGVLVQVVTYNEANNGGVRVRIEDANGNQHAFYHMQVGSNSHLAIGRRVEQGDIVGRVGSTGHSTGPHLHYEIWRNGNRNDRPNPGSINPFVNNLPIR